jgi:hypothetical protein
LISVVGSKLICGGKSFVRTLKQHLLPRYLALISPDSTAQGIAALARTHDWSNITFKEDRIYTHKIMRVKYDTYDTRRDEDIVHLETERCNIMVHNSAYPSSSPHPFRYGKVLGILHAEVAHIGSIGRIKGGYRFSHMEFLWVRWYQHALATDTHELDKVVLLPVNKTGALEFIDPSLVLRACHIVPRFSAGRRFPNGTGNSALAQDRDDWNEYFINRFFLLKHRLRLGDADWCLKVC